MKKVSVSSHVIAVLAAPFNVTVTIPLAILAFSKGMRFGWGMGASLVVGTALFLVGLYLLAKTIKLFAQIGKGTLAPWNPTQKLVVAGPYRYVRNPMYSGVLFVLLGEAVVLGSIYLLVWLLLFWTVIHVFILFYEEPGLVKRFGEEYVTYRENVPRWIPRLSPWDESDKQG